MNVVLTTRNKTLGTRSSVTVGLEDKRALEYIRWTLVASHRDSKQSIRQRMKAIKQRVALEHQAVTIDFNIKHDQCDLTIAPVEED